MIFNDNMGTVLAIQKGRCRNYSLLRIIRRCTAYSLAAGIRCSVRWVPSERNVADKDSRCWEEERAAANSSRERKGCETKGRSFQPCRSEEGQRQVDEPGAGGQGLEGAQPVEVCFEEQREGKAPLEKGLRMMLKASKSKIERARQRQRKYGKKLRASRGEMSLLEMNSVKEPTRKDYSRRLDEFYEHPSRHRRGTGHADHMFLDGESSGAGQTLRAALEVFRPEAARAGELRLPHLSHWQGIWVIHLHLVLSFFCFRIF